MSKRIVTLGLVITMFYTLFSASISVNAKGDPLSSYKVVLEELNLELGTDYTLPSASQMENMGEEYQDLIDYYEAMSIKEFKEYVKTAYCNEKNLKRKNEVLRNSVGFNNNRIELKAFKKQQKYYYDTSEKNYLYIEPVIYHADGKDRYSSIRSYGSKIVSYPSYYANSMSKSITAGNTKVTCRFSCVKYLAKNLIAASKHTLTITFNAAGGDVHKVVVV